MGETNHRKENHAFELQSEGIVRGSKSTIPPRKTSGIVKLRVRMKFAAEFCLGLHFSGSNFDKAILWQMETLEQAQNCDQYMESGCKILYLDNSSRFQG